MVVGGAQGRRLGQVSILPDGFRDARRRIMLVNRWTHFVKVGRETEVVELHKKELERTGTTARVYTPYVSPRDAVAVELEFENLEAYDRFWREWQVTPEAAAYMKRLNELIERGTQNEIWVLEE